MDKDLRKSLILNILIIIFEVLGITIYIMNNSNFDFSYYTHDSNVLALISSSIYVYYLVRKKNIPKFVSILKYASAVALSITFVVVLFVLLPMSNFNFSKLLFTGAMPYFHILCPILCFISYILYEKHCIDTLKDVLRGFYYTITYTLVLIILNVLSIVDGPYPFLRVRSNSLLYSLFYFIIISMASISLGIIINRLNKRNNTKCE